MLIRAVSRLPKALSRPKCSNSSTPLRRPLWLVAFGRLNRTSSQPATIRWASSSSSSTRWKARQSQDTFAREAKVAGLKSRAAFKLLEINDKYRIFRRGDTVVDLGYAPGSWSQVALNRTRPGGRVVGIDIIPAQPPRGVSTIQGDFLSPEIREEVRRFVQDPLRGRARQGQGQLSRRSPDGDEATTAGVTEEELEERDRGFIERERNFLAHEANAFEAAEEREKNGLTTQKELDRPEGRVVNVVLSDMMMNTSGMPFRDHAGSMDLCTAALTFCHDTLITGGHFVCKFYQGAEDPALEQRLKKLFERVQRIKPDSSRKESREAYFVCLRRRAGVARDGVLDGG